MRDAPTHRRPRRDAPRRTDDEDDPDGPNVLAHPADPTPPPAAPRPPPPAIPPPAPPPAAPQPPGRHEDPPDIAPDEFAAGFGESLRQALDLKTWQDALDLAGAFDRLEREVGEAIDQEDDLHRQV